MYVWKLGLGVPVELITISALTVNAVELPDGVGLAVGESVSTHEHRISFVALRQVFDFVPRRLLTD